MINITESKDVQKFISYLNKVNQIFKNSVKDKDDPNNSCYSLHKNTIYSFNQTLIAQVKATIIYTKKEDNIKEWMEDLSLYIDGKELFAFVKENKKYINEIEETEEGLIIKTSLPEVEFVIKKLDSKTSNDIVRYKNFKNDVYNKYIKNKDCVAEYELTKEELINLTESKVPVLVKFDDYKIKLTKTTLLGLVNTTKFTSTLKFILYKTDVEDVYIVNAHINNDGSTTKFESDNYFSILNY